jgi:general secretion pathway protein G
MIQEAMRKHRSGEEGFTLIELLIVIVILGILAAIVVFAVGGITDKGNKSACKSDLKTVETAQEANYAQTGSYAANVAALVTAGRAREAPSSSAASPQRRTGASRPPRRNTDPGPTTGTLTATCRPACTRSAQPARCGGGWHRPTGPVHRSGAACATASSWSTRPRRRAP